VPTFQPALVRTVASSGLAALQAGGYRLRPDGSLAFRGQRPGPDWHANGQHVTHPKVLIAGELAAIDLHKQRWRLKGTNQTRHSRPPDDLGLRFSALVVAVALFGWLDAALGLHRHAALFPDLDEAPSRRTLQRWLARALPHALAFQQHVRHALVDLLEPRSAEDLFPGGLPPPAVRRQLWRDPARVGQLHRGLAWLFGASIALVRPAASLLAEARWRAATETFLIG
jgi:hypothetical protein